MKSLKEYFPLIVSVVVMFVIVVFAMPVMANAAALQLLTKGEGSGTKTQENPMSKWPAFYDCGPAQIISDLIKKNGEMPMVESVGVLQIPGETPQAPPRMMQAPITQYFNGKTGTYTIVAQFNNGYSCILLFGHGLKPAGGVKTNLPADEWKKKLDVPKTTNPEDIKTIDDDKEFLVYLTQG